MAMSFKGYDFGLERKELNLIAIMKEV